MQINTGFHVGYNGHYHYQTNSGSILCGFEGQPIISLQKYGFGWNNSHVFAIQLEPKDFSLILRRNCRNELPKAAVQRDYQVSHEKNPPTFYYTGWLIGILIMVYYDPCITG